jgi:uncharacterized repeat protein (TIGR01451 family)
MDRSSRHLPWARPRHELLLLALVAVAALTPLYPVNAQDISRLCFTRSLQHGHISADQCLDTELDKARYGSHLYTDKAPGMSVIELPTARVLALPAIEKMQAPDWRLWGVRILSSGIAFLLLAFLVGRVAEGLAPGCGGATLATFALGTLVAGMAAANFGHVTAAALGFGAFLLAWRGSAALAGLAAGAALLVEYQAAAIAGVLAVYVALRGVRALGVYLAAVIPGVALLAVYDQLAFGAPWHLSYKYVSNGYVLAQSKGLFGVDLPKAFSSYEVFSGGQGLLVLSPVVIAGLWGLWLLARRYTAEVLVCSAVIAFFLLFNSGYFLPYGGVSPGPRFLIPSLPFLSVGIAGAFAWRPRLTGVLAAVSVVGTTAMTLVWSANPSLHRTVWAELVHALVDGKDTRFVRSLTQSALGWLGIGRIGSAVIVFAAAIAALLIGLVPALRRRDAPLSRGAAVVVATSLALVVIASASAIAEYPYHGRVASVPAPILTAIDATKTIAVPGDEVDFTITVKNGLSEIVNSVGLTIVLPEGMQLLGAPFHERGSGCTGTRTITCNLDFLMQRMDTRVRFGVRVLPEGNADRTVAAWATIYNTVGPHAFATVKTGSS